MRLRECVPMKIKDTTRTRANRRRRARVIARERLEQKIKDMRLTHGLYEETLLPGYIQGYNDALTDMSDRKSTRLNSSHVSISYAVFCLKKKTHQIHQI